VLRPAAVRCGFSSSQRFIRLKSSIASSAAAASAIGVSGLDLSSRALNRRRNVSVSSVVIDLRSRLKAVEQTSERGPVRHVQLGEHMPQVRAHCPEPPPTPPKETAAIVEMQRRLTGIAALH
jgi:hypothetical protein